MKRSRRDFFKAGGAAALTSQSRAAVTDRIDCQSHLFSEEFLKLLERRNTSPYLIREGGERYVIVNDWKRKIPAKFTDVNAKLADMNGAGIKMAALSINDPGPELFGKDSPAMAVMLNDFIADNVRQHPTRFFGLGTLPFNSTDSMLKELDRCVHKLGMKGILLYSNLDGHPLDEEGTPSRELFGAAEKLGIPLLLHPARPVTYEVVKSYEMAAGIGLMFDTTIALCRLILSGVLEQHPNLKLVCPHVGGALPYLIGRVDHQTMVLKRGAQNIRKAPSLYLKNVWMDTVTPIGLAIKYAWEFSGPEKLLYSSDHPWVDPNLIVQQVESQKLPASDLAKIYNGNARLLFNL
jgi:predicted TIM-barrel fold metal-dependent hydrolase